MSLTKLRKQLIEDISDWCVHHEFTISFDQIVDLADGLIVTMKGTILDINNLPKTDKDDEEHYQ